MPSSLRRALLLASSLQLFGPNHPFTAAIEHAIANNEPAEMDEQTLGSLRDDERSAVIDRLDALFASLPAKPLAA